MGTAGRADGSAGDADYSRIGIDYSTYRRPDPSIAAAVVTALGDAESIVNVGAGAGSYEPTDRTVTPVEPSATMRAQRQGHLATAVDAYAEQLPFDDKVFDAALASFTVHQWRDLWAGVAEMRRVTRGPIVILTCDPREVTAFWLNHYAPEVLAAEARRYPAIDLLTGLLGGQTVVTNVPVPLRCTDGFGEAYYGRPETLLNPAARRANSAWSFVGTDVHTRFERQLGADLASGLWDGQWGHLRTQPTFDGSLRLVVARR